MRYMYRVLAMLVIFMLPTILWLLSGLPTHGETTLGGETAGTEGMLPLALLNPIWLLIVVFSGIAEFVLDVKSEKKA